MSEPGDFVPPPQWRSHDFKQAHQQYDAHAGRSYTEAVSTGKVLADLIEKKLYTKCIAPFVIVTDETGSMGKWPGIIFSKLPYLELEGQEYLGADFEISFAAIGDAHNIAPEDYPLQVRPFTKGIDLKKRLEELVIEGDGGGQGTETYELAALYYARNVSMPNAINPILVFIGDEMPYDFILPEDAKKYMDIIIPKRLTTHEVFQELKRKFTVYLIRKPYGHSSEEDTMDVTNRRIFEKWAELLGSDHIADLPTPERVVDVIFGILAKETGRIPYFRKEITDRQTPKQVQQTLKALKTVHALPLPEDPGQKKGSSGKSIMHPPRKK